MALFQVLDTQSWTETEGTEGDSKDHLFECNLHKWDDGPPSETRGEGGLRGRTPLPLYSHSMGKERKGVLKSAR